MSDTLLKYQCPACGAPLEFSAQKQKLFCESCESEFETEMFAPQQPATGEPAASIDWSVQGNVTQPQPEAVAGFICKSCGAEIVSDGKTVATECMYCGNPVVMSDNVSGMVTPDVVIPFKIDKKQAEQMLLNFYKGKRLLPKAFTTGNRVSKITGLYVPFWLFSSKGEGDIKYTATKVSHWSDDDYDYTRTETYDVMRRGEIAFDNIPVDASTKMEDDYMDGVEPFDYSALTEFSPMYMAGYFADKFDVSVDECSERANSRVTSSLEDSFLNTVNGYTTVDKNSADINLQSEDIKYALMPVWMLNTKYNGKLYQFAINGQTGRVSGELPIDKGKLFMYRLGIFAGSFVPLLIILNLFF